MLLENSKAIICHTVTTRDFRWMEKHRNVLVSMAEMVLKEGTY